MATAVLLSGGLDSAVLLADEASRLGPSNIQPIYVSTGLAWEEDGDLAAGVLLNALQNGSGDGELIGTQRATEDVGREEGRIGQGSGEAMNHRWLDHVLATHAVSGRMRPA